MKNLGKGKFQSHEGVFHGLLECIEEFDKNRFLNQFDKIRLVKGDANETIPIYLENNQHLIVSLLFLDFDIYRPTKTALDSVISRIPKGGIVAFDDANNENWMEETVAMVEYFKSMNNLELKKFEFDPNIY